MTSTESAAPSRPLRSRRRIDVTATVFHRAVITFSRCHDITLPGCTVVPVNRKRLSIVWSRLPRPLRRLLVISAASVLFGLGMIFSVLPGPGIPLLVAGLATLAVEYAWAHTILERLRQQGNRLGRRFRRRKNTGDVDTRQDDPSMIYRREADHLDEPDTLDEPIPGTDSR